MTNFKEYFSKKLNEKSTPGLQIIPETTEDWNKLKQWKKDSKYTIYNFSDSYMFIEDDQDENFGDSISDIKNELEKEFKKNKIQVNIIVVKK